MVTSSATPTLYVNPLTGQDSASGTAAQPLQTLTQALSRATPGTLIQLREGYYTARQGEKFPLVVPPGVTVLGRQEDRGAAVVIEGGDKATSDSWGSTLVLTLCLGDGAELRGVTVTNPLKQGTGIWVEGGRATIAACRVQNCGREGLLVTQGGNVGVYDSHFLQNQTSGITFLHQSKGEVQNCQFQEMRLGLAIGGDSSPLVIQNQIQRNEVGIALLGAARPVLRRNWVTQNQSHGLMVKDTAQPDLGHPQDPGLNIIRENQTQNLYQDRSAPARPLVSVGNWLNPTTVNGPFDFAALQVPPHLQPGSGQPFPSLDPGLDRPPAPSTRTTARSVPFSDLAGHWSAMFVAPLSDRGFISGFPDGSFRPDRTLTRAEYAALLAKVFDLPLVRMPPTYQDLSANFWAREAILRASRMGFLSGFPDGSFRPQQFLTRIQTIVSLVAGLGLKGGQNSVLEFYDDRVQIPSYAVPAVTAATQHQLVVNYPDRRRLEPLRPATRGETAALIYQALVALGKAPALDSPYRVTAATSLGLPDLRGHWSESFIRPLASRNLVQGFPDGSFQPDRPVNRAEYAVLLTRAFQPSPQKPAPSLTDVPEDFWAREAIITAMRGGFLAGSKTGRFQPLQPVLRFQVLLSLASGLGLKAGPIALLNRFADADQLPSYAEKAVAAALEASLIVLPGLPVLPSLPDRWHNLQPNQPATRAEVMAMIYQGLVYQGRVNPVQSATIVSLSLDDY
ncbi:MAG: S-layer homology domain-containing protein [Prochlorothrix sp.]